MPRRRIAVINIASLQVGGNDPCEPQESQTISVSQLNFQGMVNLVLGTVAQRSTLFVSEYATTLPSRQKGRNQQCLYRSLLSRSLTWSEIFTSQDAIVPVTGWWTLIHTRVTERVPLLDTPHCLSRLVFLLQEWNVPLLAVLYGLCQAVLLLRPHASHRPAISLDAVIFVVNKILQNASPSQLQAITLEEWSALIFQVGVWEMYHSSNTTDDGLGLKSLLKGSCMRAETTVWKQHTMAEFENRAASKRAEYMTKHRPSAQKLQTFDARWNMKRADTETLIAAANRNRAELVTSMLQECETSIAAEVRHVTRSSQLVSMSGADTAPAPRVHFYENDVIELNDNDDPADGGQLLAVVSAAAAALVPASRKRIRSQAFGHQTSTELEREEDNYDYEFA